MNLTKEQRNLLQRIINSPVVSADDSILHEIALKVLIQDDNTSLVWKEARNALYDLTEDNLGGVQDRLREIMAVSGGN